MSSDIDKLEFTQNAWESLYDVVDDEDFIEKDARLIFKQLASNLKFIPFGDYLKRYIYRKASFEADFENVTLKEFQQYICNSFKSNNVPASFKPTTAKLSALSKNWLTQTAVKRNVVFLLGFGLNMSVEDVNEFLSKSLHEQKINFKDPFEIVCWYCFKNNLTYRDFYELWNEYMALPASDIETIMALEEATIGVRNQIMSISNKEQLMSNLANLKADNRTSMFSVTAKRSFIELYREAQEMVAYLFNMKSFVGSVRKGPNGKAMYDPEDISVADLEQVISAAIPVDNNGNLAPIKMSRLNEQFDGKRFNRQHMSDIINNKSEINRFDLITLNFFVFSQKISLYDTAIKRYNAYVESMNIILETCNMDRMYVSNPYECFILMCMLSQDPLATYADVWEFSYLMDQAKE